jgi:hypothetical protein
MNEKQLDRYYCVLWMPNVYHKSLIPIDQSEISDAILMENEDILLKNVYISDDISDDISDIKQDFLYLDITLKAPADRELQLRSIEIKGKEKEDSDYVCELFLKSEGVSRNGMIKYSYEYDACRKNPLLNSDGNIIHAVYHAIKRFYHMHKFHEASDSILYPFFSKKENVDINIADNKPLMHYMIHFEEMFRSFVDDFEYKKERIDFYYSMSDGIGKDKAFNSYKRLLDECTNALGISLFTNTLLLSKHNKAFKAANFEDRENTSVNSENRQGENNSLCTFRQSAINLSQSIEYVRLIKISSRNFLNVAIALVNLDSLSRLNALQEEMTLSIKDVKGIQNKMDIASEIRDATSKRRDTISLSLGIISLFLGIISFCLAYI